MPKKINRAKVTYSYSGSPKSYWAVASKKNIHWIPKNEKESEWNKQKTIERKRKLSLLESAARKIRKEKRRQSLKK